MKPILCNTQVVQNILAGRQTQDRRPIKPQPNCDCLQDVGDVTYDPISQKILKAVESTGRNKRAAGILTPKEVKPKYQAGDVLYVRETWQDHHHGEPLGYCLYRAEMPVYHGGVTINDSDIKWRPNIHMKKKDARIFLKVTEVRVERIQDIGSNDIASEGVKCPITVGVGEHCSRDMHCQSRRDAFIKLWGSIYPGSWDRNDWVFVYEFERCEKP